MNKRKSAKTEVLQTVLGYVHKKSEIWKQGFQKGCVALQFILLRVVLDLIYERTEVHDDLSLAIVFDLHCFDFDFFFLEDGAELWIVFKQVVVAQFYVLRLHLGWKNVFKNLLLAVAKLLEPVEFQGLQINKCQSCNFFFSL